MFKRTIMYTSDLSNYKINGQICLEPSIDGIWVEIVSYDSGTKDKFFISSITSYRTLDDRLSKADAWRQVNDIAMGRLAGPSDEAAMDYVAFYQILIKGVLSKQFTEEICERIEILIPTVLHWYRNNLSQLIHPDTGNV